MKLTTAFMVVLAAGAAAWVFTTADNRRVTDCREAGVTDLNLLARCSESTTARDAVLKEVREAWLAEQRATVRKAVVARLVEVRASSRAEVDKSRYERTESLTTYGIQSTESTTSATKYRRGFKVAVSSLRAI